MEEINTEFMKQAIFEGSISTQKKFDKLLIERTDRFISLLAESFDRIQFYLYYVFLNQDKYDVKRIAICFSLLFKAENHLIASFHNLRLGFLDLSHGISRSAWEAMCTAVLISDSRLKSYEEYIEDKLSTTSSLTKLIRCYQRFNISVDLLNEIKEYKEKVLNKSIHPTLLSLSVDELSDYKRALGGEYDPLKEERYVNTMDYLTDTAEILFQFLEVIRSKLVQDKIFGNGAASNI